MHIKTNGFEIFIHRKFLCLYNVYLHIHTHTHTHTHRDTHTVTHTTHTNTHIDWYCKLEHTLCLVQPMHWLIVQKRQKIDTSKMELCIKSKTHFKREFIPLINFGTVMPLANFFFILLQSTENSGWHCL